MSKHHLIAAALLLASATAAHAQTKASRPGIPRAELDAIRAATEKYQDVKVAEAEGYILPAKHCVVAGDEGLPVQLGAMGYHYVRPDLLGITAVEPRVNGNGTYTDFLKPAILMYEPQPDGSLVLVGVENLVWAKAWQDAGNTEPPTFHGFQYYYMQDNPLTKADEAHGFEPHYELHLWLYRDNPNGRMAQFNSEVTCEFAK